MLFRALTMFRFPTSLDLSELDARLRACALKPVGLMELSSRGFVPPLGPYDDAMCHRGAGALWLAIGGEDRLLPAAVIDKALQQRLDQIREREGRMPGGRARKRLREEIVAELLPRSHVKPSRLDLLLEEEYPEQFLADRLGYKTGRIQFSSDKITVRNAARIERLYRELTT